VKILIIVNESPWGSSLGMTALRLARVMVTGKARIAAVFFREEGVYHAQPGRAVDGGTICLNGAWRDLSKQAGAPLLVCSAAAQRRLKKAPQDGFREAGLAEILEIMARCDRVVTF
jgi:sulfur relay protein TusD/DsrE